MSNYPGGGGALAKIPHGEHVKDYLRDHVNPSKLYLDIAVELYVRMFTVKDLSIAGDSKLVEWALEGAKTFVESIDPDREEEEP